MRFNSLRLAGQFATGQVPPSRRDARFTLSAIAVYSMRQNRRSQPVAVFEALDHYTEEAFPRMEEMLEVYRRGLAL